MQRRIAVYAGALAAAALLGAVASWTAPGRQLDRFGYDLLLRAFPPPPERSSSILLAIDEASLQAFGGILAVRKPLGDALAIVARHEPAAIAVDLVLSEPRTAEEDEALAAGLAASPNLILAAALRAAGGAWEEPLDAFRKHASALGHVHAEPDDDGVCRRLLLAKAAGRQRLWAMALEAWRLANGGGPLLETPEGLEAAGREVAAPLASERELLIRFVHPEAPIERISLREVLENPAVAGRVRGRVVFVGVQVLGGPDRYLMTPYSRGQAAAGVEINANAYETLARGRFLRTVKPTAAMALALLTAVSMAAVFALGAGRLMLAAAGLILAAAHTLPAVYFAADRVLPVSQILLPAWACFLAGSGLHYLAVRGRLDLAETQRNRYQRAVHYVTHEMRTPLTAIQGSSELISRYEMTDEKKREMGALIHRESQRLGKMVEMFLSVERLSSGQLGLRREAVDPSALLAECIERVRPLAVRKRIAIRHAANGTPMAWGDREFLEYACYNLLSNAVKYSPAETAITVRAWLEDDQILVSVEDQGYGMDEKELRHIFRKFYRARPARLSGETGTGLGLALVEEIVVQHGGSIAVESQPGRGSRFTLRLPRCPADEAAST